jgi:hypothetical protein
MTRLVPGRRGFFTAWRRLGLSAADAEDGTQEDDGAGSTLIEFDIELGRTYQYAYTQLFPIGLGIPSTADVYLGMKPCERTQIAAPRAWCLEA